MQLWRLPHIQLAPEIIYTIPGINFPITNTFLCTWITIAILLTLFFFATRRRDMVPRGIQNFMEWIVELLLGLVESISGKKNAKKFFPLVGTFFFFILIANLLDLIPGVDSIGSLHLEPGEHVSGILLFGEESNKIIPWIRPATSDLNLTIGMAIIAVVTAQCFGFYTLGFKGHVGKYINLKALVKGRIIEVFVGLLELIGEVTRVISLSFRLFGNIFAGSIVLTIFAFLLPALGNVIFLPFELLVAGIQAFVFSLLTLIYLQSAVTSHEHHEGEHGHGEAKEVAAH